MGVRNALVAALLFGASAPFAKIFLRTLSPMDLAGALYLGSGLGLALWRRTRRFSLAARREPAIGRSDWGWLIGAIFSGGVVAPVLLMIGLATTPASSTSLLLNLESVLTALVGWFVFHENFDRRILLGMVAIVAGGALLSYHPGEPAGLSWGAVAIAGACFCWALDNNLTRKVSAADPMQIAMLKGLSAGAVNLSLGLIMGGKLPPANLLAGAALLGFLSYGVSLTCFVLALRDLGAARTGAYFSTAPFIGVILSLLLLHEVPPLLFWPALLLMVFGVWMHLTEHHEHDHYHEAVEHDHLHRHDAHHQHEHAPADPPGEPHSHWHRHQRMFHRHTHAPDLHHRHSHR
ncbi:MAG: EamA family transporter [Verrucomicrobia bacterium]|nr:EamA family transporter [Verrucomicrobiota bacterium]